MSEYSDYRVTFDSLFSKDLTTEEAHHVVGNFDKKLQEVRGLGKANVAETAVGLWNYFNSPGVPGDVKLVAGVALLYFIMPCDLIPDVTVFFGYADDLAIMAMALRRVTTAAGLAQVSRKNFRAHYGM